MVAEFGFKNTGKQSITVLSTKADCSSCTTVDLVKKKFLPGEDGVIKATFVFGDRVGLQKKHITIETDDPKNPVTVLTINVTIPEILKITPAVLYWQAGKDRSAKTINLKVGQEVPLKIVGVDSTHEVFLPQLEAIKEGKEYQLTVEPGDAAEPAQATFFIQTDFPKDHPKTFKAYAFIKAPSSLDQFLQISPEYVYWERNEARNPKTFKVTVQADKPVKLIGVESMDDTFHPKLKVIKVGKEYEVSVTPTDTSKPLKAAIHLQTDLPTDKPIFSASAVVK
ncbi:MAG: DUF1573 domain-containing protein [Nitrospira sp.]|nr:DUF1573 domain-containing protein [Nitrospira sp.]